MVDYHTGEPGRQRKGYNVKGRRSPWTVSRSCTSFSTVTGPEDNGEGQEMHVKAVLQCECMKGMEVARVSFTEIAFTEHARHLFKPSIQCSKYIHRHRLP